MTDASAFLKDIKKSPDHYYIIHYSSEHLFDETISGSSPRITSIVVNHYSTGQIQSFAIHTVADLLGIPKAQVAAQYDLIEKEMLTQFFSFVAPRTQHLWVHWNMRTIVFGFEHLEHRYKHFTGQNAPTIPVENRINLNDVLRSKYGELYAAHPQMINLMRLQGDLPKHFLTGEQESQCFANQEFIRMHLSTISKVQFFGYAIRQAIRGKLRTQGKGLFVFIDRCLESRWSRVLTFTASMAGFSYLILRIAGLVR